MVVVELESREKAGNRPHSTTGMHIQGIQVMLVLCKKLKYAITSMCFRGIYFAKYYGEMVLGKKKRKMRQ